MLKNLISDRELKKRTVYFDCCPRYYRVQLYIIIIIMSHFSTITTKYHLSRVHLRTHDIRNNFHQASKNVNNSPRYCYLPHNNNNNEWMNENNMKWKYSCLSRVSFRLSYRSCVYVCVFDGTMIKLHILYMYN